MRRAGVCRSAGIFSSTGIGGRARIRSGTGVRSRTRISSSTWICRATRMHRLGCTACFMVTRHRRRNSHRSRQRHRYTQHRCRTIDTIILLAHLSHLHWFHGRLTTGPSQCQMRHCTSYTLTREGEAIIASTRFIARPPNDKRVPGKRISFQPDYFPTFQGQACALKFGRHGDDILVVEGPAKQMQWLAVAPGARHAI